jgi:hypothetical protein
MSLPKPTKAKPTEEFHPDDGKLGGICAEWPPQKQGFALQKKNPWRQNGADGASIWT